MSIYELYFGVRERIWKVVIRRREGRKEGSGMECLIAGDVKTEGYWKKCINSYVL